MTDLASGVIAMLCESYAEFPKAFDRNTMQAVYALTVVSCAAEKSKHPSWIWASWMHKLKVASVEVPGQDRSAHSWACFQRILRNVRCVCLICRQGSGHYSAIRMES
jgi:hypothetical protein